MSIITKALAWVEGLFKKAGDELENVILPAAIAVTNALKTITDLDTADILGKIAGAAGAALEDKVKALLPGVIQKLQLSQMFKGLDPNATLAGIIKIVNSTPIATQTAFWIEFSGQLNTDLQDGKLDLGESAALLKYYYDNHPAPFLAAAA